MSRSESEQMGEIRERLIKKRDEVFEAHSLAMKHGLSCQNTISRLKKQRRRRLWLMFWQYWTKQSRKRSRP